MVKVIFWSHFLEVKLVIVTEYAVKNSIEKNDSNKSCKGQGGLSFGDLDFELDLEVDLDIDSES